MCNLTTKNFLQYEDYIFSVTSVTPPSPTGLVG